MIAYIKLLVSLIIFGSIGLFVREIPMPSGEIVLARSLIGGVFLLLIGILKREKMDREIFKSKVHWIILSGIFLGTSWLCLFEAYRHMTISVATLTYYLAPVIVILLSPLILNEGLTLNKVIGVILALVGTVLVNGVGEVTGINPRLGFIYGLISAMTYAGTIMINKKVEGFPPLIITIVQLFSAGIAISLYLLFKGNGPITIPSGKPLLYLLIVCIGHTGIGMYLYFGAIQKIPGQSVAILSYIDPLAALLLSALFLGERLGIIQIIGAGLILGGAAFSELSGRGKE